MSEKTQIVISSEMAEDFANNAHYANTNEYVYVISTELGRGDHDLSMYQLVILRVEDGAMFATEYGVHPQLLNVFEPDTDIVFDLVVRKEKTTFYYDAPDAE